MNKKDNITANQNRDKYYCNLVNNNIARYRKLFELTQEKLNEILDYSDGYISKVESENQDSNFSISTLIRISILFDIPFSNLFLEQPKMPSVIHKITEDRIKEFHKSKINYEKYYETMRKNIKRCRTFYNGGSQKELSIKIGMNKGYLGNIESTSVKQRPSLEALGRIADALEIPITELLEEIIEK